MRSQEAPFRRINDRW